jgi:hypothetical protein
MWTVYGCITYPTGWLPDFPAVQQILPSDLVQIDVLSIGGSASQQVTITMICHPSCASEMAIEGAAGALRVAFGIDVKDDSCNIPPVRMVSVSIQQPEIGDDVLLVIGRQHGIIRCQVRNIGIKRG